MNFSDNYFDDEVRDGFFVPALMKRMWAAQLETLEEIDRVCKRHGIKWFADCGTLLGAVRHGGYVPWDDDFDICMLRDDYNKFMDVAAGELPEGYLVLSATDESEYTNWITRVSNSNRISFEDDRMNKYHNYPYCVGIDVFVLDYISPSEEEENIRKNLFRAVSGLYSLVCDGADKKEIRTCMKQVEMLCNVKFDLNKSIEYQCRLLIEKYCAMFTSDEAQEVALMPFWVNHGNHKYKIEYFADAIKLPYENTYIQVPAMYEEVLNIEYGNYMCLVQSGGVHDYPHYKVDEEFLRKTMKTDKLFYRYYFSDKDLEFDKADNKNIRKMVHARLAEIAGSIAAMQSSMWKLLVDGDVNSVPDMLMQCQDSAINMGNLIEKLYGEGHVTVNAIELYCEKIYTFYECIMGRASDNMDIDNVAADLEESLSNVLNSLKKDILSHREVVFMPYKASMWNYMDGLWNECMRDENCDVYVVPVPYIYKRPTGEVVSDHYEGDMFPEKLDIIHYSEYNLEQRCPDTIYFQYPYDEYNAVFSVYPFCYSSNLRKYTDELVFVQPFKVDEIEPGNDKARYNISQYFCNKGIMLADKIVVQSENMRKMLIDVLTDFAGESTRHRWEKRLISRSVNDTEKIEKLDKERIMSALPDSWNSLIYTQDGSRKKLVLYYNSIGTILEYKERAIEKIKYALDIFKKNSDKIVLVWRDNPAIGLNIEQNYPELLSAYSKVIDEYRKAGWGIYDDEGTLSGTLSICDAYYGDVDSMVQKLRRAEIPVMLADVNII